MLVYDLVWTSGQQPQPGLEDDAAVRALAAAVEAWRAALAREQSAPSKLALPLGGLQRRLPGCCCLPGRLPALAAGASRRPMPAPRLSACTAPPRPPSSPAEGQYDAGNFSFDSLAGTDKAMAALTRACPELGASLVLAVQRKRGIGMRLQHTANYELVHVSACAASQLQAACAAVLAADQGRQLRRSRGRWADATALQAACVQDGSYALSRACMAPLLLPSLPLRRARRPSSMPSPSGWARTAPP